MYLRYTYIEYITILLLYVYSLGCPGIDSVSPINRDEIHLSNLHRYPSLIHLLLLNGDGDLNQIAAKFDQPEAPPSTADDDVYYTNTDDNPSNNMPSNLNITDPNDDYDTYYHDDKLTAAGVTNTKNSVYSSKRILPATTSSTTSTASTTATSTTLSGASAASYGMNRLAHAKKLFHEVRDRTSTSDIPSPDAPTTIATSSGASAALLSSPAASVEGENAVEKEEEEGSKGDEVVAKKPARVQYGRSKL